MPSSFEMFTLCCFSHVSHHTTLFSFSLPLLFFNSVPCTKNCSLTFSLSLSHIWQPLLLLQTIALQRISALIRKLPCPSHSYIGVNRSQLHWSFWYLEPFLTWHNLQYFKIHVSSLWHPLKESYINYIKFYSFVIHSITVQYIQLGSSATL